MEEPIIVTLILLGLIALICTAEKIIAITTKICNHAKDRDTNQNHKIPLIT